MNNTPLGRLLIVDDEAAPVRALEESLREHGYETASVTTGEAALQQLRERQFDLLLADLDLPGMNGVELLVAALTIEPQLAGVFMTGRGSIETAVRAMKAGALDYVLKPVTLGIILPVLARAASTRRLRLENLELRDTVAIHELSQAVAYTLDSNILLGKIADAALAQFEADEVSIMLLDGDGETLVVAAARGEGRDTLLGARLAVGEGIAGVAAASREPLVLEGELDAARFPQHHTNAKIYSAMSMPMVTRGKLIGVLNVAYTHRPRTFPAGQVKMLSIFTNAAAAGMEAARLYESMRRAESRYREVLQMAADGIISIDENERIVVFNASAEQLFGYRAAEMLGQPLDPLLPPGVVGSHGAYVRSFGQGPVMSRPMVTRRSSILGRRKDGALVDVDVGISKHSEEGRVLYTAVVHDNTERRRAEQEILELNASLERRVRERTQQLEAANHAKSEFLASMSHELRTPLNSIIGFSELLENGAVGELTPKQHAFVGDILGAGTHLLSLINDILDLSKIEAGIAELDLGAVDIGALLRESAVVVREKAFARRIRFDARIDPSLGTMLVDRRRLKQIAYNLLSNAVKFTPDGGTVTLRAGRCARAALAPGGDLPGRFIGPPPGEDGDFLAITVEDTGVGIAEEHLPLLFEPFTQVDSSISRRQSGTGLGLSLVRRLAELHGGSVGVESRAGTGSRFHVWLPYRAAASTVRQHPAAPEIAGGAGVAAPLALVIDDDDLSADGIAAELRREGFDVIRAATAEEGLALAAKRPPQLITLDIFLPSMDGWEFMRRLKADPMLSGTPVVLITAADEVGSGLARGARRVLRKPLVHEDLMAALAGMIGARSGGAPVRVLVVDDDVRAVTVLATTLEAEGYHVLRAYGGAEAVALARSARPDLVILDLMMPNMSGFEVVRALRGSERTARIPILVLTAMDLTAADRDRLSIDVNAVLAKTSFGAHELLDRLRQALPTPVKE